jgi:hypothetical protein
MTKRQLRELMDLSKGNSELGRLILQECLEGRLNARVWPQETPGTVGIKYAVGGGVSG